MSAITAMSQVNVLSLARTFLSPHTHAYLSQGLGFMHVDETENGLMLTKLDFSATKKMSGNLPARSFDY